MPNDITVTKNDMPGSERWDVEYTADQAATVTKTMDTGGTMLDRDIKVSVTTPAGSVSAPSTISGTSATPYLDIGTHKLAMTKEVSVTPTVVPGYVDSASASNVTVSLLSDVPGRNESSMTVSGNTVTAPAGFYPNAASKAVASGSATTPATTITPNAISISVNGNGLITASNTQKTQSVTPTVSAGYVSSGTAGTITVSAASNTSQLTTQAAQTIYPSTTDQTIASGKYLTGAQTIKAVTLSNLSAGNIKKDVVVKVGDTDDDDRIISVTGTYAGGGGSVQRGVLRPDAELVGKWTMDQHVVADLGLTIPSYSTTTTTFRLSQNIDTYVGDPLTYRYFITARALTTPEYSITTLAKGRQEYSMGFAQYEWLYNSSGQMQSLDRSKSYGAYSLIQGYASTREIYWSSATGIGVYTSDAYCARQGLAAPTITSNKTITINSPSIALRGHTTYLTQTFFDAMTDIRCQYVIELWRVPLTGVDGWAHGTQMDSIFNDINNNGGTLT